LPSKNIIHSAKVASYFRRTHEFGIVSGTFGVDMRAVRERKRKMVSSWNDVYLENYKKTGAELILGSGQFIGPKTLEVTLPDGTRRQLQGTSVIINTGTHASSEPIPGLADAQPLTHIEALDLCEVPTHLIVPGSGYVGLEFAQAMRRFGSRVTVLGRDSQVFPSEDQDVSEAMQRLFEDEGIDLILNSTAKRIWGKSGESVRILLEKKWQWNCNNAGGQPLLGGNRAHSKHTGDRTGADRR
jgi:pyruvate/2-oxoglutarate dehydrogenase complex dihydrolipoamide dehydrogenase (E3) component